MFRTGGIIIGLLLLTTASVSQVYKWVDEEGNVHYSDKAPAPEVKSEEIAVVSAVSQNDVRKSEEKLARTRQRLKRDQERRLAAREEKRLQKESDQALRVSRLRRCVDSRSELYDLESDYPVFYINEKGKEIFLDDDARAEGIEYYNEEIVAFCD